MPDLDIRECAREPIHTPGSVQPHGVLLALSEPELRVVMASENAAELLGHAGDVAGRPIEDVLNAAGVGPLRRCLADRPPAEDPVYVQAIAVPTGRAFAMLAHRHDGQLILELEPEHDAGAEHLRGLYAMVRGAAAGLEGSSSVAELCGRAVAEVRRLTGFDRVMVYRFDDEWHGAVVAEEAAEGMEPYLHLRYPASDIPAQARELYRRNRLRLISDVNYRPARLVPGVNPATGRPLDLGHSVLRSVSPVHLEYLRNMGVAASMSVSLLHDGRLWGLVACHHRTPRHVPHEVRAACDLLGQTFALALLALERRLADEHARRVASLQSTLVQRVERAREDDALMALADAGQELLDLAGAAGAAVCSEGVCRLVGLAPSADQVWRLLDGLGASLGDGAFATDRLAEGDAEAADFADRAAGVMVVPLSPARRKYVLWFRPEVVRTVSWAGDPRKAVTADGTGAPRLHPRRSFELWKEQLRGRSDPWRPTDLEAAEGLRKVLTHVLLHRAEEAASQAKDQFLAVLSHELRTPLNPILTAASALEADPSLTPELTAVMRMVRRNVELETRLIDDLLDMTRISKGKLSLNMDVVDVHELLRRTLEMCHDDVAAKRLPLVVELRADRHEVDGDPARLQQVFWNLLKNAVKFTPPGGSITVSTANRGRGGLLQVNVADTGMGIDPQVLPHIFNAFEQGEQSVTRRFGGLGLGLAISRTLAELHGGRLTATSAGRGHGATFTVELAAVAPRQAVPAAAAGARGAGSQGSGEPRVRILLVEDHADTARVMQRLLERLSYRVGTAGSVAAARASAAREPVDVVVCDIGLPDGTGLELMRELRATLPLVRGIALSGYGSVDDVRASREAGFDRHLTKPVNFQQLQDAIEQTAGS